MNNEEIKTYTDEEVIESYRKIKLLYDHASYRLYRYKVEDLINDYEMLIKLRENIHMKYFSIYEELSDEDLIEGELNTGIWDSLREYENEMWNSELKLMKDIKTSLDTAINMIENGEDETGPVIEEEK